MKLSIIIGAFSQGLMWSILALGVFITYKILDFADLTTEGAYPLGAAVAASGIIAGMNPFLATFLAMICGMAAGFVTGFLNTKLKIPPLLSGILAMTGLYSVNLRIMGKANIPLLKVSTLITFVTGLGIKNNIAVIIVGLVSVSIVIAILTWFLSTEKGYALRATGDNMSMIRALGVNTNGMVILGLSIGNGLVSLSGGIMAQYNGYADIGMGTGTIVIGLASVIIGEVLFGSSSILRSLISVVFGSIIYRIIIAVVLAKGLVPTDVKLLSSVLLAVCLSLPLFKEKISALTDTLHSAKKVKARKAGEQNA
ncbi:MAG: ABC transporter permease [Clostridia bacterium]|jgi:putative ABC transport system permease protein|nr:ABC transporter permease [Clostridia bacterium]MCI2014093.1 ABC transporter permease [Clostridia bacterium]